MISVNKLDNELRVAGIAISGCNSNGVVWDTSNNEIQNQANVKAVLAAHDPWDYSLSPTLPLVKVGSSVAISITGKPGASTLTIDSVPLDIVIGDDGSYTENFVPSSLGEYVIEYAGLVAVIKAVA